MKIVVVVKLDIMIIVLGVTIHAHTYIFKCARKTVLNLPLRIEIKKLVNIIYRICRSKCKKDFIYI